MRRRASLAAAMAAALTTAVTAGGAAAAPPVSSVNYDSFDGGMAGYAEKWDNPFGLGQMATGDTRNTNGGRFNVSAVPFTESYDFSVYDHLKYIGISNDEFAAPVNGAVTFSSEIEAYTPGTVDNVEQQGVYGGPGTWTDPTLAPATVGPVYEAPLLEGQQAGAVMNMYDPCTGQLFDWFVSGKKAFALTERLPSTVTNNTAIPGCDAGKVGLDKAYTQIVREIPAEPGVPHKVAITYAQNRQRGVVTFWFDGKQVATIGNVGIPLDRQGVNYTGTYPSLGPGEQLGGKIKSFRLGHGLFSLLDAYPFQHEERPDLSVSIPVGSGNPADAGKARTFGQGAAASFDNFTVTTAKP